MSVLKKWWFWVIIIFALVGIGYFASGTGSNSPSKNYYIGNTVKSGNLEFTVTKVENKKSISSLATTEANYVLVTLKIKNIGNSETSLTSSCFSLSKGSSSYEPSSDGIYLDNGFWALETIGSGLSKTLVVAFETPTENSNNSYYTLVVKESVWDRSAKILLTNKEIT